MLCKDIKPIQATVAPHSNESKSAEAMSLVLALAEVRGSDTVYVAFSGMFVH